MKPDDTFRILTDEGVAWFLFALFVIAWLFT